MDKLNIYNLIQADLYDYLNLFNSIICNRCLRQHSQQISSKDAENENVMLKITEEISKEFSVEKSPIISNFGSLYFHVHHDFLLQKYIYSNKLSEDNVNKWMQDVDHGYFHGLMVGFMSYFLIKYIYSKNKDLSFITKSKKNFNNKIESRIYFEDKINHFSQKFFSCLLHDFVKVIEGDDNHDANLKQYFSGLAEEVYFHKNPVDPDPQHLIAVADRIELLRFDDFATWGKKDIMDYYYDKMGEDQKTYIKIFYDIVRPSLLYFFKNRKEMFIRHGLEYNFVDCYDEINLRYPIKYYSHFAKDMHGDVVPNNFAIEIDQFPFEYCSRHSGDEIWTHIKGFIKIDQNLINNSQLGYWVIDKNETIHNTHFDHMVVRFDSTIHEWAFLHRIELINNPSLFARDKDIEFLIKIRAKLCLENLIRLMHNNIFNVDKNMRVFAMINKKENHD